MNRTSAGSAGPANQTRTKKVYQKPAFRSERVFETMALACGKVIPSSASCKFNRKAS
jgi:hypothetical protein